MPAIFSITFIYGGIIRGSFTINILLIEYNFSEKKSVMTEKKWYHSFLYIMIMVYFFIYFFSVIFGFDPLLGPLR